MNKHIGKIGCVVLMSIGAFTLVSVIDAIRYAGQAERCLHAVVCVSTVLEQFIREKNCWPLSWSDLESVELKSQRSMYKWPDDANTVKQYVTVQFDVMLDDIDAGSIGTTVIGVKGPCYSFEKYLDRLETTISEAQQ